MYNKSLIGKRILYISGPCGRERWMLKISKEFEKRYNTTSFYCGTLEGEDRFFEKNNIPKDRLYSLFYPTKKKFVPDLDYIKEAENKYGFNCWDIWQITAPRKKNRMKMTYSEVLIQMEHVIKKTEYMLKKFKPDYVVCQGPSCFLTVLLFNIPVALGVIPLGIVEARIPGKFTLFDDLSGAWPLLIKEYDKIKNRKLTKEEIKKAEDFINYFKVNKFKPDYYPTYNEDFKAKIKRYKLYFNILKFRKKIPNLKPLYWYPIKDRLAKVDPVFDKIRKGEKYVYYALHIDPESSTSVFGKWYVNQLNVIENISKSLPCDYKLYVKEHILSYSIRPKNYYKEIKKYPNIKLLSPYENSFDLIKNSSMVITVTGTVGWEGILLQKPVVVLGDTYYDLFDEVVKVKEIDKLPSLIKKKIGKVINREKTLKFITAMFNSIFDGIGSSPGDCGDRSMSDENIINLVDGIENYIIKQKV